MYVPGTGAARTLPDGVVSCLGSDGGFLVRVPTRTFRLCGITWRSDEGVECKRTKRELPVWVLTGTSYWYRVSEALPLVAVRGAFCVR